jgi:hypothetical protein
MRWRGSVLRRPKRTASWRAASCGDYTKSAAFRGAFRFLLWRNNSGRPKVGEHFVSMLFPFLILAVMQTWSVGDSPPVEAELSSFNFAEKTVTLKSADGDKATVATADLSLSNRIQLILSPTFVSGYPKENWTPQQTKFVVIASVVPAFYFLFAFWMAAAILLKRASPLRALLGFGGGWLLGLLLVGTYVIMGARIGQSVGLIAVAGFMATSVFVSVYISAIYETSTWNGFKLFGFHLVLAVCLILISSFTVSTLVNEGKLDELLKKVVFEPIGMMGSATAPP